MALDNQYGCGRNHSRPRRAVVALAITVASSALIGSCSATPRTVVKTIPGPTVTVTLPGPTVTVTKTVKVEIAPSMAPSPAAAVAAPTSAVAAPTSAVAAPLDSAFDRAYAIQVVGDVIDDIKAVDYRLHDGIAVSSALVLLSGDYGRLANAGTPQGVAAKSYQPRLSTLASFASTAADEYDASPMEGQARYEVVRKETGPLFQQLNSSLGTHFVLP